MRRGVLKSFLPVVVVLAVLCAGCYQGNTFKTSQAVWGRAGNLAYVDPESARSDVYKMLLVADIHVGSPVDTPPFDEFFGWLDSLPEEDKPLFVYVLGDLFSHGLRKEAEEYNALFVDELGKRGIVVYNMLGNHDAYCSGVDVWKKYSYPHETFYCVQSDRLSWYTLDTGTGLIGKEQMDALLAAWKGDSREKVLLTHVPMYGDMLHLNLNDTKERNLLLEYCMQYNVKWIFTGHEHPKEVKTHTFGANELVEYVVPSFTFQKQLLYATVDENAGDITFDVVSIDGFSRQ